ncbi:helix-hairpin-helix protein [Marinicella litoralis]|uniref:Helix-hairpin-helix protein n=2 Tax=Marinicella litoralis TaxID=644220 RepID=A0A4R6X6J8_9GAMM|nr:helix-hairpin-helix protein [Marinicella litoralis]
MNSKKENLRLPITPSHNTLNLLVRAKLLLENALAKASNPSGVDSLIAMLGFDNVIEFSLRIISDHVEYETVTGKIFAETELGQMAGDINRLLKDNDLGNLPQLANIKLLRKVRNLIQHGGLDPGNDLDRFSKVTKTFFDKMLKKFFGMTADKLAISSLINDKVVGEFLHDAENQIENSEYLEAIVSCRDAFDNALFQRNKYNRHRIDAVPAVVELAKSSGLLKHYFESTEKSINLLKFGVDSVKYDHFQEILLHIPHELTADKSGNQVLQRKWSLNDAQFCYSFVSNQILKWENESIPPLYEDSADDYFIAKEYLDGVWLKNVFNESTMVYFDNDTSLHTLLFVTDNEMKSVFESFQEDCSYEYVTEFLREDRQTVETKTSSMIKVLFKSLKIITHNPVRWAAALHLKQLPLTWKREDLIGNQLKVTSLSINEASSDELFKVLGLRDPICEKIISLREEGAKILSLEQLLQIEGINEFEIKQLRNSTRL